MRHFRNWISWIGLLLAASALCLRFFSSRSINSPAIAILTSGSWPMCWPQDFSFSAFIIALFGAILQWRREQAAIQPAESRLAINIDLVARRATENFCWVFAVRGGRSFCFVTALGSYQTYQVTESVQFCGKACHLPMEPEFVASQHTAHARVECVACHVGPGAAAYFKTKLNGVKQLYHAVRNDFERPIRVTCRKPAAAAGHLRTMPLAAAIRRQC